MCSFRDARANSQTIGQTDGQLIAIRTTTGGRGGLSTQSRDRFLWRLVYTTAYEQLIHVREEETDHVPTDVQALIVGVWLADD